MAALFHHLSLVDDNDPVSFLDCAQSVSYHNHCATMKILVQSLLDLENKTIKTNEDKSQSVLRYYCARLKIMHHGRHAVLLQFIQLFDLP